MASCALIWEISLSRSRKISPQRRNWRLHGRFEAIDRGLRTFAGGSAVGAAPRALCRHPPPAAVTGQRRSPGAPDEIGDNTQQKKKQKNGHGPVLSVVVQVGNQRVSGRVGVLKQLWLVSLCSLRNRLWHRRVIGPGLLKQFQGLFGGDLFVCGFHGTHPFGSRCVPSLPCNLGSAAPTCIAQLCNLAIRWPQVCSANQHLAQQPQCKPHDAAQGRRPGSFQLRLGGHVLEQQIQDPASRVDHDAAQHLRSL